MVVVVTGKKERRRSGGRRRRKTPQCSSVSYNGAGVQKSEHTGQRAVSKPL